MQWEEPAVDIAAVVVVEKYVEAVAVVDHLEYDEKFDCLILLIDHLAIPAEEVAAAAEDVDHCVLSS